MEPKRQNVAIGSIALVTVLHIASVGLAAEDTAEQYVPLIKAYLYQEFAEIDSELFTKARFGDADKNALEMLGLQDHPQAERVRSIIADDYKQHWTEYTARSQFAQSKARKISSGGANRYQQSLWDEFVGDSRYVTRIMSMITGRPATTELRAEKADVSEIRQALQDYFAKLDEKSGCDANPLIAFSAVETSDPMLAAAVYDIMLEGSVKDPRTGVLRFDESRKDMDENDLCHELSTRGWTIGTGDNGDALTLSTGQTN